MLVLWVSLQPVASPVSRCDPHHKGTDAPMRSSETGGIRANAVTNAGIDSTGKVAEIRRDKGMIVTNGRNDDKSLPQSGSFRDR